MHFRYEFDGQVHDVRIETDEKTGQRTVIVDDVPFDIQGVAPSEVLGSCADVRIDDIDHEVARIGLDRLTVNETEHTFGIQDIISVGTGAAIGPGGASVRPPMPGKIVALNVHEGQVVEAGEVLLVLEAMKMQNEVNSPARAKVAKIETKIGDTVDTGDVLVVLVAADDDDVASTESSTDDNETPAKEVAA